jgi:hypothetical protein
MDHEFTTFGADTMSWATFTLTRTVYTLAFTLGFLGVTRLTTWVLGFTSSMDTGEDSVLFLATFTQNSVGCGDTLLLLGLGPVLSTTGWVLHRPGHVHLLGEFT